MICYVSAEFACVKKGKRVDFSGMKSVEDAVVLLRSAENNVTSPTAETNPFEYLKSMNPDFTNVIELIIEFWNRFSATSIRSKYNYCKHKGKPAYSEIEKLRGERLMGFLLKINQMVKRHNLLLTLEMFSINYLFGRGLRNFINLMRTFYSLM